MALLVFVAATACAQPRYNYDQMSREQLNRGLVAVRTADGVALSWRTLHSDGRGEAFDVYRNGKKLNAQPLTTGGTFFVDKTAPADSLLTYEVRGGRQGGTFVLAPSAPTGYLPIPMNVPEGGVTPDGRPFRYSANDCSVGDVDGDGQYELFVKWDPSNARDNSHDGFTGNVLIDCYRLTGEQLWRIDLGRNIRAGAHYTQFLVYDFDGDGRCELVCKTADGTTDAHGKVVGDATADWRVGVDEARQGKQAKLAGRIMSGPEFLTVFSGLTGDALCTVDYVPPRGDVSAWGDRTANRCDRFLAAVAYLDGRHASAVFCRGYYTRTVVAAFDWDGHGLKTRWVFDTDDEQWRQYAGQGNHNLRVADVDGDGCDEITYGSMAIDNDGRGLYNTGMGHGDAIHLMAFDPRSQRLQVWDCHENRRDGSDFRDAATGEVIFQIPSDTDVGRAMAADIDPTNYGVEMWSTASNGIRDISGNVLLPRGEQVPRYEGHNLPAPDNTQMVMPNKKNVRLSVNFGIWWDGDLLRELLDRSAVKKFEWVSQTCNTLERFEGTTFNNGTKQNPCLSGDIIGDWREEVLTRTHDSRELRLYVTTIPTDYRINCLMEDIPYRLSIATENVGYNQPPEPGFYLGPDRTDYLK